MPNKDAAPIQSAEVAELTAIYDMFGIGAMARNIGTLTTSIRNVLHFADLLHAVEREFFMVPGEADPEFEGEEPDDECLVNCWGSTQSEYIEQFRAALARLATTPAQPIADVSAPTDSIRQLMKFYAAATLEELIETQAKHVERLQAKLPSIQQPAFTRVREG